MSTLGINGALKLLLAEQTEVERQFAEAATLLRQVETAFNNGDRAEASRVLTAATDACHELGLDIGELFDELGLVDGAEERAATGASS